MENNYQEEAIKGLAGMGDTEETGNDVGPEEQGEDVTMPYADFVEEHTRLIALLRKAGQQTGDEELLSEADSQEQELNDKTGGGEVPVEQAPEMGMEE